MRQAGINGPVVILNASQSGCDPLILTISGVQHVALPDITIADARNLVNGIHASLAAVIGEVKDAKLTPVNNPLDEQVPDRFADSNSVFQLVLANLWMSVVQPVLRALKLHVSRY